MAGDDPQAFLTGLHAAWFSQSDLMATPPHILLRTILMMTARGPIGAELLDQTDAGGISMQRL